MSTVLVTPNSLSDASRAGRRRWRKQALPFGPLNYKGRTIEITKSFAEKLKSNFDAGARDHVQVSAKGAGGHSDDWRDSMGTTIGVDVDDKDGIFVVLELDKEADDAVANNKLRGVSLAFDPDWTDPYTETNWGPTLRHVALTNVPYVKGTSGFAPIELSEGEEIVFAENAVESQQESADIDAGKGEATVPTLDELKAALKSDHGIDVDSLSARVDAAESEKVKYEQLKDALKSVELSEESLSEVGELREKADLSVQLSERVENLESALEAERKARSREAAESKVRPYLAAGKIVEADKEKFIELCETSPEIAETALRALSGNVLLSEVGIGEKQNDSSLGVDDVDAEAEISRLAELAKK